MLTLLDSENHIHNLASSDRPASARAGSGTCALADPRAVSAPPGKNDFIFVRIRRRLTLYAGMAAAGAALHVFVH